MLTGARTPGAVPPAGSRDAAWFAVTHEAMTEVDVREAEAKARPSELIDRATGARPSS
jgi:hypothetical protein